MEEVEEEYTDWESDPDAPSATKKKIKKEGNGETAGSGSGKKRKSDALAGSAAATGGGGSAVKKEGPGTLKKGAPGSQANLMRYVRVDAYRSRLASDSSLVVQFLWQERLKLAEDLRIHAINRASTL